MKYTFGLIFVLLFFSCGLFDPEEKDDGEHPKIVLDIEYRRPLDAVYGSQIGVYSNRGFRNGDNKFYSFSLDTGELYYQKTDGFQPLSKAYSYLIHNGKLIVRHLPFRAYFEIRDIASGELEKAAIVTTNEDVAFYPNWQYYENRPYRLRGTPSIREERYLYYGTWEDSPDYSEDSPCLIRIDLEALEPSSNGGSYYLARPEVIYRHPYRQTSELYFTNDLIIFNAKAGDHPDRISNQYIAINAETYEEVWRNNYLSYGGIADYGFYSHGDQLFINDTAGFIMIDPSTGSEIFKLDGDYGSSTWTYQFKAGRYFYATLGNFSFPQIFKVDLDEGKIVWKDNQEQNLGASPVYHKGLLYVVLNTSMLIYNAENGKVLAESEQVYMSQQGIDGSVFIHDTGEKELMIVNAEDQVIAVELNHELKNGKLVKR